MIVADDIMVMENGGTALIIVRLVNEIEGNFTLNYATGEVVGGASGKYRCATDHYSCDCIFMCIMCRG